jgi:hypothetical protein
MIQCAYWSLPAFGIIIPTGPTIKFNMKLLGECSVRQIELLRFVFNALESLKISYAVVGSFASSAWGEPRMTRDIDIVVALSTDQVEPLCAAFPEDEFCVSRAATLDAVRRGGQFNVIHPQSGNKIVFMIAGNSPWAVAQLSRCKWLQFEPGTEGYVATPEDVILGKLVYYHEGSSEKHLRDITGILDTSRDFVDRSYIAKQAAEFGVADIWREVVDIADRPDK